MTGKAGKIEVDGVAKVFGDPQRGFRAIDKVDLTIADGEFICIVGPSGCGKSTLIRMFAGLEHPSEGQIRIAHDNPDRPVTAMIFQQESAFT